ncbi:glycosyltransferase family 2 protein [Parapedobacter sp. DT-150]|uniref:glycosyltransferase family 2 protein n=1 Tax=Parapedobacter sp. DT-150 TaxID=3396162 RepID=UPI003F1CCD8F
MSTPLPLVSIITPAYNVQQYIGGTIVSVIRQTYPNWELIIVDDHSTDGTYRIASGFAQQDHRIRVSRTTENAGAATARNRGIALARGAYIAFLDSDDLWMPRKLEVQIRQMQEADAWFSFTAYWMINEDGQYLKTVTIPRTTSYPELLKTDVIGCLTAVYNAERMGKLLFPIPEVNTGFKEDYILWLQVAKMIGTEPFIGINQPLAAYRVRKGGMSANKLRAAGYQWVVYRKVEELNRVRSAVNFLTYAYHGVIKHYGI